MIRVVGCCTLCVAVCGVVFAVCVLCWLCVILLLFGVCCLHDVCRVSLFVIRCLLFVVCCLLFVALTVVVCRWLFVVRMHCSCRVSVVACCVLCAMFHTFCVH